MSDVFAQCRAYILCGFATMLQQTICADRTDFMNFVNTWNDADGKTLLTFAIQNGQSDCVKILLLHGANPNVADASYAMPLGCATGQPEVIAALIDANLDLDEGSVGAILWEQDEGLTEAVFEKVDNVDAPVNVGGDEFIPLIYATKLGFHGCVEILIRRGANVDAVDGDGYTALAMALEYGGPEYERIVHMLTDSAQ